VANRIGRKMFSCDWLVQRSSWAVARHAMADMLPKSP